MGDIWIVWLFFFLQSNQIRVFWARIHIWAEKKPQAEFYLLINEAITTANQAGRTKTHLNEIKLYLKKKKKQTNNKWTMNRQTKLWKKWRSERKKTNNT